MKLQILYESGPIIRSVQWSPAVIRIQYPDGSTWDYLVNENSWLKDLLRKHKRNPGRLVAALKRMNVTSYEV